MAEEQTSKYRQSYKLVFLRSEDLRELRSFDLSAAGIYVLMSTIFILLGSIIWLAIVYTPLKQLVPGYGKIQANTEFLKLVSSLDDLENEIEARQTYMNAFQTMLSSADLSNSTQPDISNVGQNQEMSNIIINNTDVLSGTQQVQLGAKPLNSANSSDLMAVFNNHKLISPVSGIVSSSFNPSIKHYGIDILAPANTAIRAIMDGYVFTSGWDLETGYTIGVQHDGNILSFYKHNSQLLKEKGTFVTAGEALAIIGNTGTLSTGPHLHFELWHNGIPVNPANYLNLK